MKTIRVTEPNDKLSYLQGVILSMLDLPKEILRC